MSKRKLPKPPSKRKAQNDPCAMLSRLAWYFVAAGRQLGDDDETIAGNIKQGLINALSSTDIPDGNHDVGEGPEKVRHWADAFRRIFDHFDLDVSDQISQESWLAAVERATTAALSRSDGQYARRPKLTPVQLSAALTVTARRMAGQSDTEIRSGCRENFVDVINQASLSRSERRQVLAEFDAALDAEIDRTRPAGGGAS